MERYAQTFQYDILNKFIRMQPQDQQLANSQPLKYIKRGVFFYQNINYIQSKLQRRVPIQKQLGICLLCQMYSPLTKSPQAKKILPMIIVKYVVSQLKSPIMLFRARALEIFTDYGLMQLDQEQMIAVFEGVFGCLTKNQHHLVRIKAASAFNSIIRHSTVKDLIGPLIKDHLSVYLPHLQNYDLKIIISPLQNISQMLTAEISLFAYNLVKVLRIFFKYFSKDLEQSKTDEYDEEAELTALAFLKTIASIIIIITSHEGSLRSRRSWLRRPQPSQEQSPVAGSGFCSTPHPCLHVFWPGKEELHQLLQLQEFLPLLLLLLLLGLLLESELHGLSLEHLLMQLAEDLFPLASRQLPMELLQPHQMLRSPFRSWSGLGGGTLHIPLFGASCVKAQRFPQQQEPEKRQNRQTVCLHAA